VLEVLIGGPQHGAVGVRGDGDLEVSQRQKLTAITQVGGE
jgi:hypothetical protein